MDEGGVQQICLSAWYRPSGPVVSNADVAEFTRAYPDRIIGIAGVDLNDPVGYVKEVEHYVRQENFKGVRVVPWLWNLPPTSREYWPLFVKCCELDIPFLTQVGHTGPLCPSEVGRPVPYIDEVALKFPKLKIIGGHIGYPWTQEMIAVAWKHENVFIDTSAYLPKYYPPVSDATPFNFGLLLISYEELIQFANTIGRKKVMFGTNFPQLMFKACVESGHKHLKLREEVKPDFFGGNAARVLKLDTRPIEAKAKI